jgi:O-antigen ligase
MVIHSDNILLRTRESLQKDWGSNLMLILSFYLLYALSILSVYILPNYISYIFFSGILLAFLFSKKNFFWVAFILVIIDSPGGFFPFGDINYGIPMLKFPALVSYQEIFLYLALLKSIIIKSTDKFVYKKSISLLAVYFVILILISFPLGTSAIIIAKTIKWALPWTMLYSVPRLIKGEQDWERLFRLIFTFTIAAFISQIVELILGVPPAFLLGTDFSHISGEVVNDQNNWVLYNRIFDVYRLLGSYFVGFLSYIGSMYYLLSSRKSFTKTYLVSILILSVFSVFLSATRGYIMSFFVGLILFLITVTRRFRISLGAIVIILLLVVLVMEVPIVQRQITGVILRIETTSSIFEGDFTAEGTNKRITDYTPVLLSYFSQSPIFGWGFSDTFWDFNNGHAGMPNLLANVGILGFLIFLFFWWELFFKPIRTMRRLSSFHPYKKSLITLSIGLIVLLGIHSFSGQMFQYLIGYYNTSFVVLIFICFSSFSLKNAASIQLAISSYQIRITQNTDDRNNTAEA